MNQPTSATVATFDRLRGQRGSLVTQFGVLAGMLALLYSAVLRDLVAQWANDPEFSHGFVVPLFSGYMIWRMRRELFRLAPMPAWSGILVIAFGLGMLVVGVLGAELFLSRTSFIVVLGGLVVLFGGWRMFRKVFFAWAVLFLMVPLPVILYNQITFPLQFAATKLAAGFLSFLRVPAVTEGNIIHLKGMSLEVAEACSGIRSLLSLGTLAIIYGYLLQAPLWKKVALALATVPIALITNGLRIVATAILGQYGKTAYAQGFFHGFSGWLLFMLAVTMFFIVDRGLKALSWCLI